MGYCFGGELALLTAATGADELPIRNLVALTTPCDFRSIGFLADMFLEGRLDADDIIDDTGLVPAAAMDAGFQSIKPTDQLVQPLNLWDQLWNADRTENFLALYGWTRDQIPFPGALFRQTVELLIRDNALRERRAALRRRHRAAERHQAPVPEHLLRAGHDRPGAVRAAAGRPGRLARRHRAAAGDRPRRPRRRPLRRGGRPPGDRRLDPPPQRQPQDLHARRRTVTAIPLAPLPPDIAEHVESLGAKQVNLYRALAHAPELLRAWINFAWALRGHGRPSAGCAS